MIPKTIHYCWFGDNPIPDEHQEYIKSWKTFCPDYDIKLWNEKNYDLTSAPLYVRQALESKQWVFVVDYVRLDIIYHYGGIYLDTDVELVKNLDDLLDNEAFCGVEFGNAVNLGLMFGARQNSRIIKELRDIYVSKSFYIENGELDLTPTNYYSEQVLVSKGFKKDGTMQVIEGLRVYPQKFFGSADLWLGDAPKIYKETYSIHHYASAWWSDYNKQQLARKRAIRKKYGQKRFDSGRAFVIADFWDDVDHVNQENGKLRSILYAMRHFGKAYFGKMEK